MAIPADLVVYDHKAAGIFIRNIIMQICLPILWVAFVSQPWVVRVFLSKITEIQKDEPVFFLKEHRVIFSELRMVYALH